MVPVLGMVVLHVDSGFDVHSLVETIHDPSILNCHFSVSFLSAGGPSVASHSRLLSAMDSQPDLVIC